MEYNFKIRVVEVLGDKLLQFVFEEKGKILSDLLESDIRLNPDFVYKAIDKVLQGNSEREKIFGNVCGLDITKDITKVYDNLLEPDELEDEDWCEISTIELRNLIEKWIEENKKFREEN